KSGIVVEGIHDVAVRFSKCCSPVPGDEIVGFVTRGRGVSIHRTDCINLMNLSEEDRARLIEAEWNVNLDKAQGGGELYTAEIKIYANNRSGVLVDVSKILTENKIDVTSMNVRTNKQGTATISIGFEINGVEQLRMIVAKLRNVESVIDIERTTG
ncbi:MAG: relA, partial [Anaerocolumna sp.]|nr:relA [Anaerocolumna sp.]